MPVSFLYAILSLGGLGLLLGLGLAVASKKFAVTIDPKIEQVLDVLPGANCGGCGYPGCSGFAEAVVGGKVLVTDCKPGGPEIAEKIAEILGVEVGDVAPEVASVHCQGGRAEAVEKCRYEGLESCAAAELIAHGSKGCQYGCLGLGDCVRGCPYEALAMSDNGLPVVLEEKCTACGLCVSACPRDIMQLIPKHAGVYLGCVSQDRAKAVKTVCTVGCIGCKLCSTPKVTPSGAITMDGNLPVIDYTVEDGLENAVTKCPTKSFVLRLRQAESDANRDRGDA
ncbi:MAG: Fe-S cluster domain-containing protein [Gemmatimonadota bacterium]|nr:MAG: Fe-S cluster domain-containing protein [Gemmatimonadota bacterium]